MTQITLITTTNEAGVRTMSSLDMVAYINASREPGDSVLRHDTFMAKVPKVLGIAAPEFSGTASYEVNGAVRQRPVYNFPQREAQLMAMSYSYKLQAAVYDAWQAAEAKLTTFSIPKTFAQALRLAADSEAAKEAALLQLSVATSALETAAPKIEFHDAVVADEQVKTFEAAAKLLGIGRNRFCAWLRDQRYTQVNNVPYQHAITSGWLESAFAPQFVTASGKICPPTTYVTGKGLAYFFSKLQAQGVLVDTLQSKV